LHPPGQHERGHDDDPATDAEQSREQTGAEADREEEE
jgi:hypothetical protein